MLNIEQDLHMAEGEGEHSYTKNSRRQVIILSYIFYYAQVLLCNIYASNALLELYVKHYKSFAIYLQFTLTCTKFCIDRNLYL